MKRIVNGKQYNTETARLLGSWDNGEFGLMQVEESLYRTKSGNYFIHGSGGPMTIYAEFRFTASVGGEKIIPISAEQADEWAESKLSGDEYESIFGEVPENEVGISATISEDTKQMLDQIKKDTGETTAELLTRLIVNENK